MNVSALIGVAAVTAVAAFAPMTVKITSVQNSVANYVMRVPKTVSDAHPVRFVLDHAGVAVATAESTDFYSDPVFQDTVADSEDGDVAHLPETKDKPKPKPVIRAAAAPAPAPAPAPQRAQADGEAPAGNNDVARSFTSSFTAYTSLAALTDASPWTTADGTRTHYGVVANNCLPFGTRVRFPDLYGDTVFVVHDRMNSRYGCYMTDVWLPSYDEAIQFGAKRSTVEVLK